MKTTRITFHVQHDYLSGPLPGEWRWMDTSTGPQKNEEDARRVEQNQRDRNAATPNRFVRDWRVVRRETITEDTVI